MTHDPGDPCGHWIDPGHPRTPERCGECLRCLDSIVIVTDRDRVLDVLVAWLYEEADRWDRIANDLRDDRRRVDIYDRAARRRAEGHAIESLRAEAAAKLTLVLTDGLTGERTAHVLDSAPLVSADLAAMIAARSEEP